MMRQAVGVLLLAAIIGSVMGVHIPSLSFRQPFEEIDGYGNRVVGQGWVPGGHAVVKRTFIRLTPDRPDKKGYLWNSERINRDEFSIIFRFRISGQGKRWFGDGIGLFITLHRYFLSGELHGFTPKFQGVGIIFDTFHNVDHVGGHKDVAVLFNHNNKTLDDIHEEPAIGCDSPIRFHEDVGTFSTLNHTRARISYKNKKLKIDIDATAKGQWQSCFEQENVDLGPEWPKGASIGISAQTGALADNHDILSLDAFTEADDASHEVHDAYVSILGDDPATYDKTFTGELMSFMKKLERFKEDMEHTITTLKDYNQQSFDELAKTEAELEKRTAELEAALKKKAEQHVQEKVSETAHYIGGQLEVSAQEAKKGGGWIWAFSLFFFALCGVAYWGNRKLQRLTKSRLL